MAAAAPTLTPVTLELGGKSPVIVAADADIDVAARRIAWVKLLNSGQTCIAPDYVLAERSIADELVDKIVANVREFRSGEGDPSMQIVNQRQFDRLVSLISATDGTVVTGGGFDSAALRIEPTVIVDPSPTDAVMADEIFGPILPVLTVDSLDSAAEFVNGKPKPLALYLFTPVATGCTDTHRSDPVRRCGGQPRRDALHGASAAVRRRRRQRDGRLPRPVGLRSDEPPQGGPGQAGTTRPEGGVPAVHRQGDQDDAKDLLMHRLSSIGCTVPGGRERKFRLTVLRRRDLSDRQRSSRSPLRRCGNGSRSESGHCPPLRWKLVTVPFGLDRPVFVESEVNLDDHVSETTLAAPADEATLAAEVANILAMRLDRDKPLWKLQVIHGLPGRTAVVMTLHHAAVDGIAASEIFATLLDGPDGHVVGTQR